MKLLRCYDNKKRLCICRGDYTSSFILLMLSLPRRLLLIIVACINFGTYLTCFDLLWSDLRRCLRDHRLEMSLCSSSPCYIKLVLKLHQIRVLVMSDGELLDEVDSAQINSSSNELFVIHLIIIIQLYILVFSTLLMDRLWFLVLFKCLFEFHVTEVPSYLLLLAKFCN